MYKTLVRLLENRKFSIRPVDQSHFGEQPGYFPGRSRAIFASSASVVLGSGVIALLCSALSGCGGITVKQSTAASGTLFSSTSSYAFGSVDIGTTSNTTLSFVNQGSSSVQIYHVTLTGQA